jgi:hypothetical protein
MNTEKYSFPCKDSKEREQLEQALQKYGKLQQVSQLDTTALGKIIQEKLWEPEVLAVLQKFIETERRKRFYLSKIKEQ